GHRGTWARERGKADISPARPAGDAARGHGVGRATAERSSRNGPREAASDGLLQLAILLWRPARLVSHDETGQRGPGRGTRRDSWRIGAELDPGPTGIASNPICREMATRQCVT